MHDPPVRVPPSGLEIRHKLPPLKALTPLRFLAAVHVVLFHNHFERLFSKGPAHNFIDSGYTGVTFFFVLSGFILAYNYQRVVDASDFWAARFARIYPLYAASLLIMVIFHLSRFRTAELAVELLLTLSMLQSWFGSWAFALNGAAWTLSDEAFFYAAFPLVLRLFRSTPRRAGILIAVLYLAVWSIPEVLHLAGVWGGAAQAMAHALESAFPLFRFPPFLIGVFAGLSLVAIGEQSTSCRYGFLSIGAFAAICLLCISPSDLMRPAHTAALAISYCALVYGAAYLRWGILIHPISQLAGEISFGMYILQVPVGRAIDHLPRPLRLPEGPGYSILFLLILIVVSYVTFRFVEVPCRLFIRRALTGKPVLTRPL
jgi:peptidoglycan/LPS O-acetylase OafA/YrhL